MVLTTIVDPSTTRLQRRELIRQGKPVPTIEIDLPRREKPLGHGGTPEFALFPTSRRRLTNSLFERRSVSIAESSSSARRKAEQSKKDKFCKVVIKKGKRVRVCKVRTPKKKTKTKTRSRPKQENLFGKELFGKN